MNAKELKEYKIELNNKTLGEIKGMYSERLRISIYNKEQIREKSQALANLDFDNKYYADKAKNLMNDITFYKKDIQEDEYFLKLIKPVLDKKEIEGINQSEYEDYITNNVDIKVLIKAVDDDKQQFIADGSKVVFNIRNKEGKIEVKTIILTEDQVNEMFDTMLKETIMIIKDNVGDLKEVKYLRSNGNRGMDGQFIGEKGIVNIATILAGGYNIQPLHYRTLVHRYTL